mgnify:CR=1
MTFCSGFERRHHGEARRERGGRIGECAQVERLAFAEPTRLENRRAGQWSEFDQRFMFGVGHSSYLKGPQSERASHVSVSNTGSVVGVTHVHRSVLRVHAARPAHIFRKPQDEALGKFDDRADSQERHKQRGYAKHGYHDKLHRHFGTVRRDDTRHKEAD